MLVPNKYEDLSKNFFSVGIDIVRLVKRPRKVYNLYTDLINTRKDKYEITFNRFLLTLDFLFAVGIIELENNRIMKK